jgi:protein-tyrosine phosphatase
MANPTIYWIDHSAPGRLAILAKPEGNGALENEIRGWRDAGVDVVVSLLTEADNQYLGLEREGELCRSNGLQFVSFPIKDLGVPASVDVTLELVKELSELAASGKNIGFHCHGCIGRAPLIASCVLMYAGKSPETAYDLVSLARGYPIPEARTQAEWGRNFARALSLSTQP